MKENVLKGKGAERTTLIYDLRHRYKLYEGSERYENGAGSAPWSTYMVDDHRPCDAEYPNQRSNVAKRKGQ